MSTPTLLLPHRQIVVPTSPSYIKFLGAFGLGEGTTLFDRSRYRSHGTISGADWVTGLHGKALDFVKTSKDYVEIPASHTQLNFTSENFSIVMRILFDTMAGGEVFLCRSVDSTDGWYLGFDGTPRLFFETSQSGAYQISRSAPGDFLTDTRYTLGITRDGASVKIYKDGVDVTYIAGTHIDPATADRSMKIGIYDDKSYGPFDGEVEFLAIFGVALSASEHLAWHNALA